MGGNFAATKHAADFLPPLPIVALRFTAGGLLLLLVLRLLEPGSRLKRRDVLPMALLGCFGLAGAQAGFTFGLNLTSAANAGLVFATVPVWGMLLGAALGLERPTRRGVLGVGLSVLGVGIVFGGGLGAEDASLAGDVVVLPAAMCAGAYAVFSMPLLERYSPLAVAAYPTIFGGPVLLLLSSPYLARPVWGDVGLGAWAAVTSYAAVFAPAFAFAAWQRGIRRVGANRVLAYQYLITLTPPSPRAWSFSARTWGPGRSWAGSSSSPACTSPGASRAVRRQAPFPRAVALSLARDGPSRWNVSPQRERALSPELRCGASLVFDPAGRSRKTAAEPRPPPDRERVGLRPVWVRRAIPDDLKRGNTDEALRAAVVAARPSSA